MSGRRAAVDLQPLDEGNLTVKNLRDTFERNALVPERDAVESDYGEAEGEKQEEGSASKPSEDPHEDRRRYQADLPTYKFDAGKGAFIEKFEQFHFPYRRLVRRLLNKNYKA